MMSSGDTIALSGKTTCVSGCEDIRSELPWHWPTDRSKGALAEKIVLEYLAGLPVDDPTKFRQLRVQLSGDKERFINTIVVDQNGLEAESADRLNVVLVNGLGAALGVFYRNLSALSHEIPNARIWAIDWLGMGLSGRPPFPCNPKKNLTTEGIDYFLEAFEEWREVVKNPGLEEFILLGHSLGGYLSALYALRHPRRVKRLILASPAGLPPDHNTPEVEEAMGGVLSVTGRVIPSWLYYLWENNYTPQWFLRKFGPVGPRIVKAFIDRRFPTLPETDRLLLADYMYHVSAAPGSGEYALGTLLKPGAWAREPLHGHLANISMPTVFICSRVALFCHPELMPLFAIDGADDWMDYRHAEEAGVQMAVPTKVIRIPNSGHQLHMENPDDFNRIVIEECRI